MGAHVPARRAAHLRDGRSGRGPARGARRRRAGPHVGPVRSRRSRPEPWASPPRGPRCTAPPAGAPIPTLRASSEELMALADGMRRCRHAASCSSSATSTRPRMTTSPRPSSRCWPSSCATSGRPLSFTMQQAYHSPDRWRHQMAWVDAMVAAGHDVKAQVAPRPIGVLLGLAGHRQPLRAAARGGASSPSPRCRSGSPPCADPERKRRILAEHAEMVSGLPDGSAAADHQPVRRDVPPLRSGRLRDGRRLVARR